MTGDDPPFCIKNSCNWHSMTPRMEVPFGKGISRHDGICAFPCKDWIASNVSHAMLAKKSSSSSSSAASAAAAVVVCAGGGGAKEGSPR